MASFLLLLLIGSAAVISTVTGQEDEVVPNEYLLELSTTDEDAVEDLEACGLNVQNTFLFDQQDDEDAEQIMIVHANATDFDEDCVKEIPGFVQLEPNSYVETSRKVIDVSAAKAWGLNRIDQREKLESTDPLDSASTYQKGPYRGI